MRRLWLLLLVASVGLVAALPSVAHGAQTTKLFLEANGNDIAGVSGTEIRVHGPVSIADDGSVVSARVVMVVSNGGTTTTYRSNSTDTEVVLGGDPEIEMNFTMTAVGSPLSRPCTVSLSVESLDDVVRHPDFLWNPVSLTVGGEEGVSFDGAILVVSAVDGPMP